MALSHGAGVSFVRLRSDSNKLGMRRAGMRENFWLNGRQDELRLTLQYVPDQPTTDVDDRIASTPVLSDAEIDAFKLAHSNLQTSSHTRARSTVLAANQGNVVLSGFEHVSFYDQLFDGPYATAGDTGDLYQLLAEKMAARNPPQQGQGIPAAYTYLGQFLAHDMSYMKWNPDLLGPGLGGWSNARHMHALDFDTIFGTEPETAPRTSPWRESGGSSLGRLHKCPAILDDAYDLPREDPNIGTHCCLDPRVDANLGLAQLHVLFVRFHQHLSETQGLNDAASKTATRQHLQTIVLMDYLPRIIPKNVYDEVMADGPLLVTSPPGNFLVPLEFALACFRFGHSMVQEIYSEWAIRYPPPLPVTSRIARLSALLGYTSKGGQLKNGRLPFNWNQPWLNMIDDIGLNLPVTTSMARPISASIQPDLSQLDASHFDQGLPSGPHSLAQRTLEKGAQLGLPSGQDLAAQAGLVGHFDVAAFLQTHANEFDGLVGSQHLCLSTPLWFYVLAEAETLGNGKLGPLGGRVVMETIVSALAEAEDTILTRTAQGGFQRSSFLSLSAGGEPTRLSDIVALANTGVL
ncbi:peroxidase family protein [Shimia sp. W99]